MEIFKNKKELHKYIESAKERGDKIGFAPTMGALHEGHLSLYKIARKENDIVIASIFVNPTQFNNAEDLQKYPRNIEKDLDYLEKSELVDAVYIPEVEDLYPEMVESEHYDFDGIEMEMEGKFRPGHFDGVATVVEKLFSQVEPDNAYFGEKDYQQLAIIRKLVELKKNPVNIIGAPIFREESGLAMSSRNERLSKKTREEAKLIYETLKKIEDWFRIISIPEIYHRVEDIFKSTENMELEYLIIADEETLKETDFFYKDRNYRAFIVVNTENVRLIDNLHLS
jgi:pantoate--beta-alanine ligase